MSKLMIRRARRADAEEIFLLVSRTIDACYTGHYSEKIVGAFHDFHSFENILRDIEREKCFVAAQQGKIVGTVTVVAAEVHRLFVSPSAQGRGIGSALLSTAEGEIKVISPFAQVDSSIPAESFYERMGYTCREERTDEVCGEPIYWKVYTKDLARAHCDHALYMGERRMRAKSTERESEKGDKNFFDRVYAAVKRIPCGKVASYGQIARMCGSPRSSRAVGYALHVNPYPGVVPCHRVVNREGRLAPAFAFGGAEVQKELLEREGVAVKKMDALYFVDMDKYQWKETI